MIKQIIGVQKVEYDKKDGGHVSGVNLFISTDIPSERGEGVAVEREYLSTSKLQEFGVFPTCGTYDIEYSKSFDGRAYIAAINKV